MAGGGRVVASAQAGGVSSGSRQVLLVEGGGPGEVRVQGGGASLSSALQTASLGPGGEDLGTRASSSPGAAGGHRVVVQHKKISVTERSVESSSVG